MDLVSFGIPRLEVFLLVLARTAGIFTLVPIFGASQVPMPVRVSVAVVLALVFVPLCAPAGTGLLVVDVLPMALMMAREALIGIVIGFVTVLVFAAIQMAGDLIDLQTGFSFASMVDPVNGSQTSVGGRFHHLLAGLLFFATNAHHIMLRGLADSFQLAPVGQLSLNAAVTGGVVDLFAGLFVVAIKIAAPVVAAVFLADVALAILARTVPQMNVFIVGLPLKLGVGLVGMAIALPVTMVLSRNTLGGIYDQTAGLLHLLGGP